MQHMLSTLKQLNNVSMWALTQMDRLYQENWAWDWWKVSYMYSELVNHFFNGQPPSAAGY